MLRPNRLVFALYAIVLATSVALAANPSAPGIKKCQDEAGKWHYGDSAAMECARTSKITDFNPESGVTNKVTNPEATDADLKQRTQEQEEQARIVEQTKKDELLLAAYANETDLIYIRDRKLAQLEVNIKAAEETLKSVHAALANIEAQVADEQKSGEAISPATAKTLEQSRAQNAKHEAAIAAKKQELGAVRARYDAELERYRALKRGLKPGSLSKTP